MKRICIFTVMLGLVFGVPVAEGAYSSIQLNMVNADPDTSYVGGVLTIAESPVFGLTLNDTGAIGAISNIMFSLNTTYLFTQPSEIGPNGDRAVFGGGSVSLSFDEDGENKFISGPITNMIFFVTVTGAVSRVAGEGLFSAVFDLPGSNDWPAPDMSSITTLTLAIGINLDGFDWATEELQGNVQSQVQLFPDDRAIPGPAALFVMLPGVLLLRRRR